MNYTFVRPADPTQLEEELAMVGLGEVINGVSVSGTNVLTVSTVRTLTDQEYQILYQVVVAHVSLNPAVEALTPKIQAAMDFGISIIKEYAAMNSLAKLPVPVIEQLLTSLLPIMLALQSGSLYTALDMMSKVKSNPYLNQSTITYFMNKIKRFLGI